MKNIIQLFVFVLLLPALSCFGQTEAQKIDFETVCNPMDISYQWGLNPPNGREGADPSIVLYKGTYYLFVSVSKGYWYSEDLKDWHFVRTDVLPNSYAPSIVVINDALYFITSTAKPEKIYKSTDPKNAKWEAVGDEFQYSWDPFLFLDDDKKLYQTWGCSGEDPMEGIELDYNNNFKPVGKKVNLIEQNREEYGWDNRGEYNTNYDHNAAIEGTWINKYNGKYYLQYATPGTQFRSYADAVYISDKPLGPYKIAKHNPFSYKPGGFATGAGHGSTFKDKNGNYWHFATVSISVRHKYERRLAMFPVFFDEEDNMWCDTRFGDYPMIIPNKKIESTAEIFPGWMLLSYNKKVSVSSTDGVYPASDLNDEDIRTAWSAKTGNDSEWASIDLGETCSINAIQVNFAERNTTGYKERSDKHVHKYIIEGSNNNKEWEVLVDKSENKTDNSHVYLQLEQTEHYRYVRIKNIQVPSGNFALAGFRIFGKGNGKAPEMVSRFDVRRNAVNRKTARVKWKSVEGATGYNVRFGYAPDRLYNVYTVYDDNNVDVNVLNTNLDYYFAIEAFNENGISEMTKPEKIVREFTAYQ